LAIVLAVGATVWTLVRYLPRWEEHWSLHPRGRVVVRLIHWGASMFVGSRIGLMVSWVAFNGQAPQPLMALGALALAAYAETRYRAYLQEIDP
jgi:hypothetical protein